MKQPVRVEYNGEDRMVKYHHEIENGFVQGKYSKLPTHGKTIAYITIGPEQFINAEAYCSAKDQFNKKIGRMVSSARLIEKIKKI